jgi:hypothetical protein
MCNVGERDSFLASPSVGMDPVDDYASCKYCVLYHDRDELAGGLSSAEEVRCCRLGFAQCSAVRCPGLVTGFG